MTDYSFAERLRVHRMAARVTQAELAEAVHRARQTVINWEKGDYLPDRETVKYIGRHLALSEADWDELLVLAGHPPYFGQLPGTAADELLEAYRSYIRSRELVRDYGPPASWSAWVERRLIPSDRQSAEEPDLRVEDLLNSYPTIVLSRPGLGGTTLLWYLAHLAPSRNLVPVFVDLDYPLSVDRESIGPLNLPRWAAFQWPEARNYGNLEVLALAQALQEKAPETNRKILWLLDNAHVLTHDERSALFIELRRSAGCAVIVTQKSLPEYPSDIQVVTLEALSSRGAQRAFVNERLRGTAGEGEAGGVIRLFEADPRLRDFRELPLALEAACGLLLERRLNGSLVVRRLLDGLLRRGGAKDARVRQDVFLCLGATACDRLRRLDRGLQVDAQLAHRCWERTLKQGRQSSQTARTLLALAERARILSYEGSERYSFRKTQFRDCMAAAADGRDGPIEQLDPAVWPHLLYVAATTMSSEHQATFLNRSCLWNTYLGMGKLLIADYAIEIGRGGANWRAALQSPEVFLDELGWMFRTDDGMDMKRAVMRRLAELAPGRALSLLMEVISGTSRRWRTAMGIELAAVLDTEEAWKIISQEECSRQQLLESARAALSSHDSDQMRYDSHKSALLALRSGSRQEVIDALHYLIERDLPGGMEIRPRERKVLGSRRFWRASCLPRGLLTSTARYSPSEARRLLAMLLVDTLQGEEDLESRCLLTRALARAPLLSDLLRIEPIPRSAVWALALRYGFLLRGRRQIVRIDGQVIPVDERVGRNLTPVSDWSAQAWGLTVLRSDGRASADGRTDRP